MTKSSLLVGAAAAVCLVVAALIPADRAVAQQQGVQLPAAVTSWLARNDVPRWAMMVRDGEELFNNGPCSSCHGRGGVGRRFGPDLTDAEWVQCDGSLEGVGEVIFWGVRRRDFADPNRPNQMHPEGGMDLDAGGLDAVTAYVWSLSAGGAGAQQQQAQLPEGVSSWMARNQVRRWASMIETGEKLFNEGTCTRCHGQGGTEGRFAPDLTDDEWVQGDGSLENIGEVIFWGVRRRDFADPNRRFEMNPQGGMALEFEEIEALTAYVWSLNNGTFLPQR